MCGYSKAQTGTQIDIVLTCVSHVDCRGSDSGRSMHSMILDSIFEKENYGKGWLGYDVMPRASQAMFVELLVSASIVTAVMLTPLLRKVVKKLWQDGEVTWHTPMLAGETALFWFQDLEDKIGYM